MHWFEILMKLDNIMTDMKWAYRAGVSNNITTKQNLHVLMCVSVHFTHLKSPLEIMKQIEEIIKPRS